MAIKILETFRYALEGHNVVTIEKGTYDEDDLHPDVVNYAKQNKLLSRTKAKTDEQGGEGNDGKGEGGEGEGKGGEAAK